ncbi:MAG: phosphopantothenate/pantothenate synthetase [Nitrososphaerota archaeon]
MIRKRIVEGFERGLVVPQGLLAHGRGEALDYILGEETTPQAYEATRAAAALLLLSKRPVISVNGNTAALAPQDIIRLSKLLNAKIEVNLFYRSQERVKRIKEYLSSMGASQVLGDDDVAELPGLSSPRRFASREGIYSADTVLVPLEDGDRAEKLVALGKKIIAIDLNPLSRTAQTATVTIVDNVVRAIPNLCVAVENLGDKPPIELEKIYGDFDNQANLKAMIELILRRLTRLAGLEVLK